MSEKINTYIEKLESDNYNQIDEETDGFGDEIEDIKDLLDKIKKESNTKNTSKEQLERVITFLDGHINNSPGGRFLLVPTFEKYKTDFEAILQKYNSEKEVVTTTTSSNTGKLSNDVAHSQISKKSKTQKIESKVMIEASSKWKTNFEEKIDKTKTEKYKVQSGDILWKIVKEYYKDLNGKGNSLSNRDIVNIINYIVIFNIEKNPTKLNHLKVDDKIKGGKGSDGIAGDKIRIGDVIELPKIKEEKVVVVDKNEKDKTVITKPKTGKVGGQIDSEKKGTESITEKELISGLNTNLSKFKKIAKKTEDLENFLGIAWGEKENIEKNEKELNIEYKNILTLISKLEKNPSNENKKILNETYMFLAEYYAGDNKENDNDHMRDYNKSTTMALGILKNVDGCPDLPDLTKIQQNYSDPEKQKVEIEVALGNFDKRFELFLKKAKKSNDKIVVKAAGIVEDNRGIGWFDFEEATTDGIIDNLGGIAAVLGGTAGIIMLSPGILVGGVIAGGAGLAGASINTFSRGESNGIGQFAGEAGVLAFQGGAAGTIAKFSAIAVGKSTSLWTTAGILGLEATGDVAIVGMGGDYLNSKVFEYDYKLGESFTENLMWAPLVFLGGGSKAIRESLERAKIRNAMGDTDGVIKEVKFFNKEVSNLKEQLVGKEIEVEVDGKTFKAKITEDGEILVKNKQYGPAIKLNPKDKADKKIINAVAKKIHNDMKTGKLSNDGVEAVKAENNKPNKLEFLKGPDGKIFKKKTIDGTEYIIDTKGYQESIAGIKAKLKQAKLNDDGKSAIFTKNIKKLEEKINYYEKLKKIEPKIKKAKIKTETKETISDDLIKELAEKYLKDHKSLSPREIEIYINNTKKIEDYFNQKALKTKAEEGASTKKTEQEVKQEVKQESPSKETESNSQTKKSTNETDKSKQKTEGKETVYNNDISKSINNDLKTLKKGESLEYPNGLKVEKTSNGEYKVGNSNYSNLKDVIKKVEKEISSNYHELIIKGGGKEFSIIREKLKGKEFGEGDNIFKIDNEGKLLKKSNDGGFSEIEINKLSTKEQNIITKTLLGEKGYTTLNKTGDILGDINAGLHKLSDKSSVKFVLDTLSKEAQFNGKIGNISNIVLNIARLPAVNLRKISELWIKSDSGKFKFAPDDKLGIKIWDSIKILFTSSSKPFDTKISTLGTVATVSTVLYLTHIEVQKENPNTPFETTWRYTLEFVKNMNFQLPLEVWDMFLTEKEDAKITP